MIFSRHAAMLTLFFMIFSLLMPCRYAP